MVSHNAQFQGAGPRVPNMFISGIVGSPNTCTQYEKQQPNFAGAQTRCEENFSRGRSRPMQWPKVLVTRMLMRDLFAVVLHILIINQNTFVKRHKSRANRRRVKKKARPSGYRMLWQKVLITDKQTWVK